MFKDITVMLDTNIFRTIAIGMVLAISVVFSIQTQAKAAHDDKMKVNLDNYIRAESDGYFQKRIALGAYGKFYHLRDGVDIDNQPVVRANRDTLYSYAIFNITNPVTITMPETNGRFQSLRVVDQDNFIVLDKATPGKYTFSLDNCKTQYIHVNVRTFVDPDDTTDINKAHRLQDAVLVEQSNPGTFEAPDWDQVSLVKVRNAVLGLGPFIPDSRRVFGTREEVNPVRHLVGTAGGWGGGSEKAVLFLSTFPKLSHTNTPYQLRVKDVPVDGFWSISIYNQDGYFQKSNAGGYSLNNVTATADDDGTYTINFGGDPSQKNFLNIFPGWNYTVRLYLPRKQILDGDWVFPDAQPVK
jgi:hypothetical protein